MPDSCESATSMPDWSVVAAAFSPFSADPSSKHIGLLSPRSMDLYGKALADYGFTRTAVPGSAIATDQFIAAANDFDHAAVVRLAKGMP